MSEIFPTAQMKHILQFIEDHKEKQATVWQDPIMQDVLAQLIMDVGLQAVGAGNTLSLEYVLALIVLAYIAGQLRAQKADTLQKMLEVDSSVLNKIVCPGCGWVGEDELLPIACPNCEYENGMPPYRLLTLQEILSDFEAGYNDVGLGYFLRALRDLHLLVVPESGE